MIAGRDTTACALSWTMFEVAQRPDVVARLRDEFEAATRLHPAAADDDDVTAEGGGSGVAFAALGALDYAHAVALEVLRLHPSVPKEVKVAAAADTLPDGTRVPPGASVMWSPWAMGRDAR